MERGPGEPLLCHLEVILARLKSLRKAVPQVGGRLAAEGPLIAARQQGVFGL